MKKDSRVINFK